MYGDYREEEIVAAEKATKMDPMKRGERVGTASITDAPEKIFAWG